MSEVFGSMPVPITAVYAALLTLVATVLAFSAGSHRGRAGISIYYGDDLELATKMRRHANFAEHVPLALILMLIIELDGARAGLLHAIGGLLLLARILHPIGMRPDTISHPLRGAGAAGTLIATLLAAGTALWQVLSG